MRIFLCYFYCFLCYSIIAQSSYTICAGAPITLTATNPANLSSTVYSISPSTSTATSTSNTFVVSPTVTTTYTLFTGGLAAGNTPSFTTSQVTVNVHPFSQFFYSVTGSPTLGCASKTITTMTLGINNAPSMTYTITGPIGVQTPSYSTSTNSLSIFFTNAGQYTTTVLQPSTGCTTKLVLAIYNNNNPPPMNVSVPSSVVNCTNAPMVYAMQASTLNLQATWYGPAGAVPNASIQINALASSSATFIASYTLSVLDLDNLCQASTVIPVYQNKAAPNAIIAPPTKTLTCLQPTLTLVNVSTTGALPFFQNTLPVILTSVGGPITLQNPGTTFTVSSAGLYSVTVLDLNNGCSNDGTFQVTSTQQYPIFQNTLPAYNLCGNSTVTLSPVLVQGPASFQWTFPAGAASQIQLDGSIVASTPGIYSVTATNNLGCSSNTVFTVVYCLSVNEIGDKYNVNIFPNPANNKIQIAGAEALLKCIVVNEAGQIMYQALAPDQSFEINTHEFAQGLYLLQLQTTEGKMITKKFMIAR